MNQFSFTIDEFASLVFIAGKQNEARGMLQLVTGNISPEEERGRFLAANNSLYMRGIITMDGKQVKLGQDLELLLNILFTNGQLVRSNKGEVNGETIITYYFYEEMLLEHVVEEGIIHKFNFPFNKDEAQKRLWDFFSPKCPDKTDIVSVNLPSEFITNIEAQKRLTFEQLLKVISPLTSDNLSARIFAEDMTSAKWRGSTVFIDQSNSNKLSTMGALWIQGENRFWMIHSISNQESPQFNAALIGANELNLYIASLFQHPIGENLN